MTRTIICVGFELQYSPLHRDCVDNLAQSLHSITSEFCFDVIQAVSVGQEIIMLFSNKQIPTQHLLAQVVKCVPLDDSHYRITLKTQADTTIRIDNADLICLPICKGPSTASAITLICPSCNNKTPFHFIANQGGDWERGILPIYNCGACGTTRTMIGLVNHCNQ